ncbi:ef-hand calcium-binding domain-containing protein 5 [Limosa lapponica baueri]|uniref:Ef-hand calcium-binding domain-containing protein 5 n=1 Tax=Limosa lapponica baueri TaxID=1758121 RepID=A0A2I0TJD9_LIMLA|nr:ef-hand calcium-binding domain-containing protein 5 [Limosa lapponica baueri]
MGRISKTHRFSHLVNTSLSSACNGLTTVLDFVNLEFEAVYDKKLEIVNTLEKKVNIDEFTEYVHFYTEHFSDDMFQEILKHFRQCADDFREAIRHDTWRRIFADLFLDRDYGKNSFGRSGYDHPTVICQEYARGCACKAIWPIIELQEIELADLWGGLDDQEGIKTERQTESASAERQEEDFPGSASPGYSLGRDGEPGSEKQVEEEEFSLGREPDTETNREEDYHMLDREPGSEVSQERDNLIAEATNTISRPAPEAVTVTSENRSVADTDIIASEQDAPGSEVVRETARKESFSRQHGSQFDQQTSSETRQQDEDLVQDQGKGPAQSDRQDSPAEASQEFEVPWSGDLLTSDLTFRYSSYGEKIPEDWKCDNTKFPDLCPIMAEIQNRRASCTRSAFDKSCLNLPQFVQLMEIFVGEDISLPAVKRLIAFIKEEYKQTEEEKMEQLKKIHCISHLAQRKLLLEALFEKWDNNASGFLDLEEVDAVLSTFKEGMEKEALRKAKQHLCSCYPQLSRVRKLSPKAFQTFLELVASEFTGNEDEAIDNLVEFLTTSVERSGTECLRSLTRRKWLHNIQQAAETSGASMEAVYKAVFKALSQDAEAHGDNKKISAYIALLEENQLSPERGQVLLRYVACTADDAPYVLNKILYRDMKGVRS